MSIYSDIKDRYLKEQLAKATKQLGAIKEDYSFIKDPVELGEYTRCIQVLNQVADKAQQVKYEFDGTYPKKQVEEVYQDLIDKHIAKEVAINDKYEAMVDTKVKELKSEAVKANDVVRQEFDKGNRVYIELEKKRLQLAAYQNEIVDLCAVHGITTSDININNDTFTLFELDDIYDSYIEYLSKPKNRVSFIRRFREKVNDPIMEGLALLGIMLLAITPIRYILAVIVLYYLVNNQLNADKNVKYYSILLGLLYNVKPLEMGFKQDIEEEKLVSEEINEEQDDRFQEIADDWEKELDALDKDDPRIKLEEELADAVNDYRKLMTTSNQQLIEVNKDRDAFVKEVRDRVDKLTKEFEEKKAQVKTLGKEVSERPVFNTKFRLGIKDGVIEEYVDLGLTNLIIKPSANAIQHKKFLQVLLANAMCNVRATNLYITIFDPNNSGQDLISFYNEGLSKYMKFDHDRLGEILKDLKATAEKNLKDMLGRDINTFNEDCEKVGKTPKDYHLLIVLSQPKDIQENEALREFMKYSARLGVLVWMVTNEVIPNTHVFRTPFENVANPYKIDDFEFGRMVSANYCEAIENLKTPALKWQDFVDIAIPEDKIWTGCADDFIELYPGFWEGDPTAYKPFTLGNVGNVHAIAVGTSGSGKSVLLNQFIMNIARYYPPWEVELWMCDFKGVEFSAYLNSPEHPFMLPHIKACLCTSDGDYATSLFKAVRNMADARYDDMKILGVKNLGGWRTKVRGLIGQRKPDKLIELHEKEIGYNPIWTEADLWPRSLFICDEFQIIFEKADSKNVDSINADITQLAKVARAAGVHVFFTSQSMKKTISADILNQFSLRFALRCEQDVSQEILGTTKASDIKEANGYLIVKSVGMTNEEQRKYRTPFLDDKPPKRKPGDPPPEGDEKYAELHRVIKSMHERAIKEGFKPRDIITYEESTVHPVAEIEQIYKSTPNILESGLFLLGPRMTYDENKAPDNIVLTPVNNSHVFCTFGDNVDLVNFYKTLQMNIKNHKIPGTTFVNSQIKDLHYICELDKDVPEQLQEMSTEKTHPAVLLEMFKTIYEMKVQNNDKTPAYYILIGWDKCIGFGIDRDMGLTSEFATLLQTCGEYGMHFIFVCTGAGGIGVSIVNACDYRISGRVDEDTSYKVLDSKVASKVYESMARGYMFIGRNGVVKRAKIYQTKIEREIKETEFRL